MAIENIKKVVPSHRPVAPEAKPVAPPARPERDSLGGKGLGWLGATAAANPSSVWTRSQPIDPVGRTICQRAAGAPNDRALEGLRSWFVKTIEDLARGAG